MKLLWQLLLEVRNAIYIHKLLFDSLNVACKFIGESLLAKLPCYSEFARSCLLVNMSIIVTSVF